jgi:hypothetical protein
MVRTPSSLVRERERERES